MPLREEDENEALMLALEKVGCCLKLTQPMQLWQCQ